MLVEVYGWLLRPEAVATLHAAVALTASSHAVLTKEDSRAAVAWVGLIWLAPLVGTLLYYLLGINRIRREATARAGREHVAFGEAARLLAGEGPALQDLERLERLGDHVSGQPLTAGNAVTLLENGDEAYPAMLAAIAAARTSIMLTSYIFNQDAAGAEFLDALRRAVDRGVETRVLVDATGSRYSFPSIMPALRRAGVRCARFMPNLTLTRVSAFNLRSHRKILVVDGRVGFTGGMNIAQANYVARGYRRPVQDLHFRVEGPVVAHLRQAFLEDWAFTTGEMLTGPTWLPPLLPAGDVLARGVLDGPDRDFEKTLWTMLGAIAAARRRIRIVTPYFLPEPTTVRFLTVAALSGIEVELILPAHGNIALVQWAAAATLPTLLRHRCKVYLTPPPFDHAKMMLIDDTWALIGSANWDARSLRLNFEFNVECISQPFAARLGAVFEAKRRAARPLTLEELSRRRFPVKLRDGVARLLAPYL